MAAAVSLIEQTVEGNKRVGVADVTFDNSYPTGGEAVTPSQFGLTNATYGICNVKTVGGTVNVANVYYDRANKKLLVFDETPAEAANAADLSTLVVQVKMFGN